MRTEGNILLCSGRQVGKSTIIAARDAERACRNANESILIISATERQSEELFIKVLMYIQDNYKHLIKTGKDRPTKHIIRLKNKSIIRCLPTGLAGTGIRGFTITKLTADEAAFIPDEVWSAVTPMLLTTAGTMDLLSTPFGKSGYFYEMSKNEQGDFNVFHINSEEVIRKRPISPSWTAAQREGALIHLEKEKQRMTKLQYAQEYLGEFVDNLRQFFSDQLIKKSCVLSRRPIMYYDKTYMGCDLARMGDDESTYEIISDVKTHFEQLESETTTKTLTTETERKIIQMSEKWKARKVGIDAGAGTLGVSILDHLLETPLRHKVVALNNRAVALDDEGKKTQRILKEDMYNNMLSMLERRELKLLADDETIRSLKSVQYEYVVKEGMPTKIRIFGNYTHIVEGLIRAAWLARKEKSLNLWVC